MTIKDHAARAAAYTFACGIAFSAGVVSMTMATLDNWLHKDDSPATPAGQESKTSKSG